MMERDERGHTGDVADDGRDIVRVDVHERDGRRLADSAPISSRSKASQQRPTEIARKEMRV